MQNFFNIMLMFFEEEPAANPNSWIMTAVLIGALVLMVVFMFIRQRGSRKKNEELMQRVRVGAKITTIGGVIGEIINMDDKGNFTILTGTGDNKSTMTFMKGAVYTVNGGENKEGGQPQANETDEIK